MRGFQCCVNSAVYLILCVHGQIWRFLELLEKQFFILPLFKCGKLGQFAAAEYDMYWHCNCTGVLVCFQSVLNECKTRRLCRLADFPVVCQIKYLKRDKL